MDKKTKLAQLSQANVQAESTKPIASKLLSHSAYRLQKSWHHCGATL